MITMVEARNSQGALLGLPLEDVSNGFIVEEVEGLDPVKAEIVSSSFAQLNGEAYQSSRRSSRDIKLTLGLEPDYALTTVRKLRQHLYNFFMPQSWVNLRFYDSDGVEVDINGYVESCEAPLWTGEPQMDVVVRCMNPDFVDTESTIVAGNTVETETNITVDYDGSVETGVTITINLNRAENALTIYHIPPDGSLRQLDFQASLLSGDKLVIKTTPGEKGAWVTRSGTEIPYLYGVSPQANWISLLPGENQIRIYATGAAVPYTIEYMNKYGGL